MNEFIINPARTVAVTGHRILSSDFDPKKLEKLFRDLYNDGYDTFLIGMALGFDTACFKAAEEMKKECPSIKIVACIPCPKQADRYTDSQKNEYERMLSVADFKVVLSAKYTPYCMIKRNRYMVNNASVLVCYLRHEFGGTFNTLKYAKEKKIKIINV